MTDTLTACAHCGGAVDPDGFCDDCGLRAGPTPAPAPPSAPDSSPRSVGRLGSGLADLPPVPVTDPTSALLTDPALPEKDRYCPGGHPVGRTVAGRPGRTTGYCPECGARFDCTPSLAPGDLVAGQYEIRGCIAHGGLGWIYLAADRNLDGKWIVLKGLLNTTDAAALAAAEVERRYLIAVDHPNIVKIHNFVQHLDPRDGTMSGYLVMEYVGGVSLADQLRAHLADRLTPMPPEWAVPCALEVLAALEYLHNAGMVYCDLKPANIIQSGDRLKLIDLGAMRRLGDPDGDVWGTVGYQAPEVTTEHTPDIASDLHTVGRTLAVLTLAFSPAGRGSDGAPAMEPLPARPDGFDESLYLLIERACHPDPGERFGSAAEMADQLTGVLRQIRAQRDAIPYPAVSAHFGPERGAFAGAVADDPARVFAPADRAEARRVLPVPLVDPTDPAAAALAALAAQPAETALGLVEALPQTVEARLARIRIAAEVDDRHADALIAEAAAQIGPDWRLDWYRGVAALREGPAPVRASHWFAKVRSRLPGELAPLLALAICEELDGGTDRYARVWATDRTYTSAAFGLARSAGDFDALAAVPASSSQYLAARQALAARLVRGGPLDFADLERAAALFDDLDALDRAKADLLEAELWEAVHRAVAARGPDPDVLLRAVPCTEEAVAEAWEAVLRRIAARCSSPRLRRSVVAKANAVRPRTWL